MPKKLGGVKSTNPYKRVSLICAVYTKAFGVKPGERGRGQNNYMHARNRYTDPNLGYHTLLGMEFLSMVVDQ